MSLRFWIGANQSNRDEELYQYILDEAYLNPTRQYLVIVPEQYNLSVLSKLVRMSKREGILNIDVLSFMRLSHRILDEVGDSVSGDILPIDDMGKNLIIRRLASKCEKKLKTFGAVLSRIGYISEIKSLISEFMQYGISQETVLSLAKMSESEGRGHLGDKLKDAAVIYGDFLEFIKGRFDTNEEILNRVSRVVYRSSTIKDSVIIFDGYTGFTPVQMQLLKTLMEYAKEINVSFVMNPSDVPDNINNYPKEHLFYLNLEAMSKLEKIADSCHCPIVKPRFFDNKSVLSSKNVYIRHLEENIFRTDSKQFSDESKEEKETDPALGINLLVGANPYEELRIVAGRINELIRTKGYRYKDIALVTGDIEGYRHVISRVFDEHGIAHFIDKSQPVLQNPFTELIRAIIEIESDNYSFESIFRMLKTYIFDIDKNDVDVLENYCIAKGIKGRRAWHETWEMPSRDVKDDTLKAVNNTRAAVVEILNCFESEANVTRADSKAEAASFVRGLRALLDKYAISDRLLQIADDFAKSGDYPRQKEYSKIYEFVMQMLTQIEDILGDEIVTVRDFKDLLDAGLDEIRIGILPAGTDYVQIGDLKRSRVNDVKAMFIVGANDGIIPMIDSGAGIISDMEKEFLIAKSEGLELSPTKREKTFIERVYLYMMMTRPSQALYFSYSAASLDGAALRPSYIINLIRNMFPFIKPVALAKTSKERIMDKADYISELTMNMRSFVSADKGNEAAGAEYLELMKLYCSEKSRREMIMDIMNAAFASGYETGRDALSKAVAKAVYGKRMYTSITRLENYAACAYNYYLKYVLNIKEREEFSFEARDLGSLFHDSLDKYFSRLKAGGLDIRTISEDMQNDIMSRCVLDAVQNGHDEKLYSSARLTYMIRRITRIMQRTAQVIKYQICSGDFETKSTEVIFDTSTDLQSLKIKLDDDTYMNLTGTIDRLDTAEKENEIIVRIIDYKSSQKDMDLAAVYEGRQLQLVVYLNAAMEMTASSIKKTEKRAAAIRCGGILYYHIEDPIIDYSKEMTDEDIQKKIIKELKLKGYVNSDSKIVDMMDNDFDGYSSVVPVRKLSGGALSPNNTLTDEQFQTIGDYVNDTIRKMGQKMLDGNIDARLKKGEEAYSAKECTYCDYKGICKVRSSMIKPKEQDEGIRDDLSDEEILELMKNKIKKDDTRG